MALGRHGYGGGGGVSTVQKAGLYVPDSFGQFIQPKLATKPVIAIPGHSVDRGYYASNLDTKSWPGLLRLWLQAQLGNGGSGWRGACDSLAFTTAAGVPSTARTAYAAAGNFITINSGTWGSYFGASGPGHNALSTGADGQITFPPVTGSTIVIYTIGGNSAWEYQIDGGAWVAGTIGAYTAQKQTITGLSATAHTVSVRRASGASGTLYVTGVSGENAAGAVINNFSVYGAQASYFDNLGGTDYFKDGSWSGGNNYPADLVIYPLGLNDAAGSIATEAFAKSVRGYLDAVKDGTGATGATDVMFLVHHFGKYDATPKNGQNFAAVLRNLADTYGAAFVNVWQQGRNSYNYWAGLNHWGNAATPGASGSDSVHLSDAGLAFIFQAVQSVFISRLGLSA